ncbi:hypothetical protein NEHOM01_1030 [Nematocida homosporus]|uniref:uncharacterized protein n=1 Tax=Nematocida homosporus TaxID=1912981 RepID=UPI002220B0C4|nr:uncharacterized protein NEHOM01_1030 [Nematocida homosporus]KAI5185738.1 hypothetical protein NEHOM01_1030 [Nematocida homosporus]
MNTSYSKIKTRLRDKLTREYKKTAHTEEYLKTEEEYRKTRAGIRLIEIELQSLADSFSAVSLYENITSGLYSGLEIVKDSIKRQPKEKSEAAKEDPDVFGALSVAASEVASSIRGDSADRFSDLSGALKRVSAARVQMKETLSGAVHSLRELKLEIGKIDGLRLKVLEARQVVEAARPNESEKAQAEFVETTKEAHQAMNDLISSDELYAIANTVSGALKTFFGDAFDAMAGDSLPKTA